jgi:hypothetical protein
MSCIEGNTIARSRAPVNEFNIGKRANPVAKILSGKNQNRRMIYHKDTIRTDDKCTSKGNITICK